jgi:hypothetical protein
MAQPLFVAVQRFDPSDGEKWQKYYQWANIPGLTEVISLDLMLCPCIITEFQPEDWAHIVNEDFRLNYFHDLEYLLRKVAKVPRKSVLGVYRNPSSHIELPPDGNFAFAGYDLIEDATQISALTNCGGFPDSFSNAELNRFGLIGTFDRAAEIHRRLPEHYPEEPHAICELYAIWRLEVDMTGKTSTD